MRNLIVRVSTLIMMVLVAGVGVAAAQPSAEPEPPAGEARQRAEDAYDTAFIVFEDEYAAYVNVRHGEYSSYGTVTTVRSAVPIRGIQRERLAPLEFYSAVGRMDLADAYESKQRKKAVVGGVSAGAFGLSLVLAGVAVSRMSWGPDYERCDVFSPTWEACTAAEERRASAQDNEAKNWAIGAGVAFIGSLTLAAIWRGIDPHPVSENERRLLAHDYNNRLRRELHLPRKREVSLSPFVLGEGGGLMAVGTF